MKRFFTYSFLFLLLLLFLFSSFHLSLNKMRCLESGYVSYSLLEAEDCCSPAESPAAALKDRCCEFSTVSFYPGISELLMLDLIKKISFIRIAVCILAFHPVAATHFAPFLIDTSPPLHGNSFLSLISIFRL